MLLTADDGGDGDVESGAARDNEEDEVSSSEGMMSCSVERNDVPPFTQPHMCSVL